MHDPALPDMEHAQNFALFENNLDQPGSLFLLRDLDNKIEVREAKELPTALAALEEATNKGLWLALSAHYEAGLALEPKLTSRVTPCQVLLRAWVFRERIDIPQDQVGAWWTSNLQKLSPQEREAGILSLSPAWTADQHARAVEKILRYIDQGDCYQVNLTFPCHGAIHGHPLALFARLRTTQPVRYGALICDGQEWMLSRSPELFFSRKGDKLLAKPMKGTIARHSDPERDAQQMQTLQASPKDRAENLMIVDLIRNDLGKLAPAGGVRVERLFEVEPYETVYQLTSSITAQPVFASDSAVLQALFPCGSVTGAPKIRAMEIIDELESAPRGAYCGALGWMGPAQQQCFNVPIRTLLVSADRRCRLDVGSGIVADSVPSEEYAECLTKSAFVRNLANDVQLIETMACLPGRGIPLLGRHLTRLRQSARSLDFICPESEIAKRIDALQTSHSETPQRIRLVLSRTGEFEITAAPLEPLTDRPHHHAVANSAR